MLKLGGKAMSDNKDNKIDMKKINRMISKTAKETAEGMISELRNRNMIKREMSYYKRVELLLYNFNNLKEAVRQKDEDIADLEKNGLPQKSCSITMYSTSSSGIAAEDRYMQLIDKYKLEKKETERDIRRIEAALQKIEKDKYYYIIDRKYLNRGGDDKVTDETLAAEMERDRTTIIRNRKRLMNKLITVLFPESIRDII